uniref:Testis expressed 264, ER-phagy receptor n=1 Tax=Meleagris gallopavo TaxID=9103 RepID=H9H252_MELGA
MRHHPSIMSDWMLLGLIAVLVVLLLLTIFAFAVYSGLFTEVVVSAGSPPVGSITLAYKFRVGPYGESGQLFTDGCSISSKLCSIGVYYDNPHTVSPEKCRFAIGRILSEGDAKPSEEQIRRFQKYGFKIFTFPTPSHVVMASFPFTTPLSIHLAVNRVHPALDTYIKVELPLTTLQGFSCRCCVSRGEEVLSMSVRQGWRKAELEFPCPSCRGASMAPCCSQQLPASLGSCFLHLKGCEPPSPLGIGPTVQPHRHQPLPSSSAPRGARRARCKLDDGLLLQRRGSCVPTPGLRSTRRTASILCAPSPAKGTSMCPR